MISIIQTISSGIVKHETINHRSVNRKETMNEIIAEMFSVLVICHWAMVPSRPVSHTKCLH